MPELAHLAHLAHLALTASVLMIVVALGMRATFEEAFHLFREPVRLSRAVAAIYLLVPLAAAALAALLHLTPAVKAALLAMSIAPLPPVLPRRELKLGARVGYVYGLLIAVSLLAIMLVPLAVELLGRVFGRDAHLGMSSVVRILGLSVLTPLILGLALRRFLPRFTAAVEPWLTRIGNVLMIAGLVPVLVAVWPTMMSLVGNGTLLAMAAVAAFALAAGHLLGGPDPDDRTALAVAATMRHPGVGIAIARAGRPDDPLIPAAILLFVLVGVVSSTLYGAVRKRQAARPGRGHSRT